MSNVCSEILSKKLIFAQEKCEDAIEVFKSGWCFEGNGSASARAGDTQVYVFPTKLIGSEESSSSLS